MDRKILTNYLYNTINEVLVILTPLLVTPYLSRTLGADGIGVFSYTQSIVTYFVIVALLGTYTYGRRSIAISRNDPIKLNKNFKEIMVLRMIVGIIVLGAYGFFVVFTKSHRAEYLFFTIYIVGCIIDINWFFIGLEEFRITVICNLVIKLSSLVFVFLFVKKEEDVPLYVLVYSFSILIGNLFLWFVLKRYLPSVHNVTTKPLRILKPVFLLFLPTIAASVYTVLDKSMLGWIVKSDYQNGCYEQAEKIVRVAITIITSFSTVIASRIAYNYDSGNNDEMNENLYSVARFIWLLAVPIMFGIISVSDLFIPFFLGPGFEDAINMMRVFSFLVISVSFSHLVGLSFLIQINRENIYTKAICFAAVSNVIMNVILIDLFKGMGAAISSVISEFFGIVYMMLYCRKNKLLSIKLVLASSKAYWISGLFMFISVITFKALASNIGNTLKLLCSVVIAVLVYFSSLLIQKDTMIFGFLKIMKKNRCH